MTKIVICLTNKFLGIEEGINKEATARDLSWYPAVETSVKLPLWHLTTLHATKTRPVVDPEVADSGQEDLNHATA